MGHLQLAMWNSLPSVCACCRYVVVAIVAICFFPETATAGCGDYVAILNPSGPSDHIGLNQTDHRPASPKLPCDGPRCSNAPTRHFPPITPIGLGSSHSKELTKSLGWTEGTDLNHTATLRPESTCGRPIRRVKSIFHPPRFS